METRRTRARWTWAEFARLPDSGSRRQEIIDDQLVVTPAPSGTHQLIVATLLFGLHGFADEHDLGSVLPGPIDVIFAEGDYLEPDIVFLAHDRSHLITDRGIEGPPDLVVEVLSPSTRLRDLGVKRERYRLYGVPEYWAVDPDRRTITRWAWGSSDANAPPVTLAEGDALRWRPDRDGSPSLVIPVGDLFRRAR